MDSGERSLPNNFGERSEPFGFDRMDFGERSEPYEFWPNRFWRTSEPFDLSEWILASEESNMTFGRTDFVSICVAESEG